MPQAHTTATKPRRAKLKIALYLLLAPGFFVFLAAGFVFQGGVMGSEFVSDIREARERDISPRLDVSDIVRRHIRVESSWESVYADLKKDGFKCYRRSIQQGGANQEIYDCVLDLRRWWELVVGNKLDVYILVKDEKVTTAAGELFYFGL